MAKSIVHRYDFNQICAGVLRLAREKNLFSQYKRFIKPELIYHNDSSEERKALRQIIKIMMLMENEGRVGQLSISSLESEIPKKIADSTEAEKISSYFRSWRANEDISSRINDDGSFEGFLDYIKILQISGVAASFYEDYQKGNIRGAVEKMKGALAKVDQISASSVSEEFSMSGLDDLFGQASFNTRYLMLGNYKESDGASFGLDDLIGGFEPETLTTFIAATGGGKSLMAIHIVKKCIEQEIPVWMGCLEDRRKSFTAKVLASMTGIPIRRIAKEWQNLSAEEKSKIQKASEEFQKYAKVFGIYGRSIEEVHKAALDYDLECELNGRPVPLVNIIDYTGHIAQKSKGDKGYERIREAYGQRKDFALENKKICFDFAQINREGSKNVTSEDSCITHNDLAGGFDLSQVCDNIITINRNPLEFDENKARIHVSKARDGAKGHTIRVKVDFASARYLMHEWSWVGSKPSGY